MSLLIISTTKENYIDVLNMQRPSDVFQLLCANCHSIKTSENRDLPHFHEERNNRLSTTVAQAREIAESMPRAAKKNILNSPLSHEYWAKRFDVPEIAVIYLRQNHQG